MTVLLALSGFFNILNFFRTRGSGLIQGDSDDVGGLPHVIQDEEQTVLRRPQEDKTNITSIREENLASLDERQMSSSGAAGSSALRTDRHQASRGLGEDSDLDPGRPSE